ncbi:Uncharacterised protein [Clostridium perfringens]|uniref:Uncharacterized protein n=1 Tax=Clostridium perfringens TaxID=1502 RepID=A0A2X2Y905_CLOPF|nr:Uncharacterised protein [Clostridium perfringens]
MNTFMILGLDFLILFLLTVILIKIENYEFRVKKGENYVM